MPVYAYKCNACQGDFKAFHGVDDKQDKCIKCESVDIQKSFLSPATIKTLASKDTPQQRIEKYIEETRASVTEQIEEARKDFVK